MASLTPYTPLATDVQAYTQQLEWIDVSTFVWGSPAALPASLSFWFYDGSGGSNVYSGAICNADFNRSFVFDWASTDGAWQYVTIPIPPDPDASWPRPGLADRAMMLYFDIGTGANTRGPVTGQWASAGYYAAQGATALCTKGALAFLLFTNVQLEVVLSPTPYDWKPQSAAIAECQRYYESQTTGGYGAVISSVAQRRWWNIGFKANKRVAPSMAFLPAGTIEMTQTLTTTGCVVGSVVIPANESRFMDSWTAEAEM